MKIQIDTTAKTIKVEEMVKFGELIEALNKLFPKEEWKEYTLSCNTIINWSNPIVIKEYPAWPYTTPYNPYTWPQIYYGNGNDNLGVYNVQF